MTERERVTASVNKGRIDAIPWQFDLTEAVKDKLKAFYGTRDFQSATGDHMVFVNPGPPAGFVNIESDPRFVRNEFGSVWRHAAPDNDVGDWGGLVSYPLDEPSMDGYAFPDGALEGRWQHASSVRIEHPRRFVVAGGYGLFEAAWGICGFQNYLSYFASSPKFVEKLTEKLADYSCAVTEQLARMDLDGIRFGDDWGFQDSLMISPELWRRLLKPYYRRIYETARNVGLIVMIHSCGNITELLPDLIDIGVEVVHPLQPEAMDVVYCKKEFGRDLAFWGGIGSQSTLPKGSVDDVRCEVRSRLELFRDGGFILAPAGAAPTDTPAENIAAMVDEARSQLS